MYKIGNYYLYKEHMNLRLRPSVNSKVLSVLPMGTHIKVEEIYDNWGKTTFNGVCGWCCISECFAKPVCSCKSEDCCYFEKYLELEKKFSAVKKQLDAVKGIVK